MSLLVLRLDPRHYPSVMGLAKPAPNPVAVN